MGIALSDLIENMGVAVQRANAVIERSAAEMYLMQGYGLTKSQTEDGADEEHYEPLTYMLSIPSGGGKKKIEVPVTALMHHTSMRLEQVEVKLKFSVEEGDGEEVMVNVKSPQDTKDMLALSELSMQFKTAPSAEGTARVENRYIQTL